MILVDASHCLYRTLIVNKNSVQENPEFIAHLFISQILSFSKSLGGSKLNKVVVCFDSSSWRKKFYLENKPKDYGAESYKGHRVKDDSIDWESVFSIVDKVREALSEYSDFITMKVEEAEADDIIAVLTKKYKNNETIWIASSDKDFVQLQATPYVNIYDPLKRSFKPTVDTEMFKLIHVMIGDASDNIKAIKERLGEKTAVKIVKELDILLQTNKSMKERFEFNKTLIDFDCIPDYISDRIIKQFEEGQGTFNALQLMRQFRDLKLVQHTEDINKFKLSETEVKTKLNSTFTSSQKIIDNNKATLLDFFS